MSVHDLMGNIYLQFPFNGHGSRTESILELVQLTEKNFVGRLWLLLTTGQKEVGPPVGRIETPMAGSVFDRTMGVTDKIGWTQRQTTVAAFDAGRIR